MESELTTQRARAQATHPSDGPALRVEEVVSPAPRSDWDDAVAVDPRALPDQEPLWTDAVTRSARWSDASRRYRMSDGTTVVMPLLRSTILPRASYVASPPAGWGFGGLVGAGSDRSAVIAAVAADLAQQRWFSLRVRPDPLSGSDWEHGTPPGTQVVRRRAHIIDLEPGPEAVFASMRKSTRRAIRRCERGGREVEVGRDEGFFAEYHRLWELSVDRWAGIQREPLWMARRRAVLRDPPSRLRALAEAFGERFSIWVARDAGEAVAANVVISGTNTHVVRAVIDRERVGSSGVMHYLDWLAIRHAHDTGSRSVNLGESGTSERLAHYKEGVGARPHDYTEVRLERLPITRLDNGIRSLVKHAIGFSD